MENKTIKLIGWALLIVGIIILVWIALAFLLREFLWILISVVLLIVGQYLIHSKENNDDVEKKKKKL